MKTFACALLCMSAYGSTIEASTQVTTGATAEIEAAVESLGHGLGLGLGGLRLGGCGARYGGYWSSCSYSSDYSASDYFSSDYSDHDYGYGYRRRFGGRHRYFRYQPRYYGNRYLYGRRYASRLGVYSGAYRSYGYRSYGYGYAGLGRRGLGRGLRTYGGHYYGW